MLAICERWGSSSPAEELEDVFFSRHVARVSSMPPLEIAQAFASRNDVQPKCDRQSCLLEIPQQRGPSRSS